MKLKDGDITSFLIGLLPNAKEGPVLGYVHDYLLQTVYWVKPETIDGFVQGLGALILAVASRFVHSWLEKKYKNSTLKIRNNGNKKNNSEKDSDKAA